jgi:hypothetical protein
METPAMHLPPPNIARMTEQLSGHTVVLADGDELGVVADIIETPATTAHSTSHALVVQVAEPAADAPPEPLVVSGEAVLTVTDDAVVLGTTATWLGQHTVTD